MHDIQTAHEYKAQKCGQCVNVATNVLSSPCRQCNKYWLDATENHYHAKSRAPLIVLLVVFTGLVIVLGWVSSFVGGAIPIGGSLP